jgi:hypothetical protein
LARCGTRTPPSRTRSSSRPTCSSTRGGGTCFRPGTTAPRASSASPRCGPATGPYESFGSIIPSLSGKPDTPYPFTLDPSNWFASEYYGEDGPVEHADYFCFAHAYDVLPPYNPPGVTGSAVEPITDIEFRRMLWNVDGTFDLSTPNPVRGLTLSKGQATVGDTVSVTLAVNGAARQRADFTVALTVGAGETAIAPSAVGLPASATLVDGTVTIAWPIKAVGLTPPLNLVVRMGNQPLTLDVPITILGSGSGEGILAELPVEHARTPSLATRSLIRLSWRGDFTSSFRR